MLPVVRGAATELMALLNLSNVCVCVGGGGHDLGKGKSIPRTILVVNMLFLNHYLE